MSISVRELADLVGGQVHGDGDTIVAGAATLNTASPADITLAESAKHAKALARSQAGAVVTSLDFETVCRPAIRVEKVREAFAAIVQHFRPPRQRKRIGVSPAAHVSPTAEIDPDADVHPGATIGDGVRIRRGAIIHSGVRLMDGCQIGADTVIYPNVVLYEDTIVGERVNIHAGAIIGANGFGYRTIDGRHQISAQLGYVEIHDDVDVGAGTTIDRGAYGPTKIGEGTKIDNQVMIAHNCQIGRHNLLCSQVGVAGSTTTGDYVIMAGQVGVRDHVHIGDGAVIQAKAGVMNNVPPGSAYLGSPATPERDQMQMWVAYHRGPEMRKQLRALAKQVEELIRERDSARPGEAA